MARIVDAAFAGEPASNVAYFFAADQHVVYDWTQDRVRNGVHASVEWGFPTTFAPAGPAGALDAALRGKGPFAGKAYFFRGPSYARWDWALGRLDPADPQATSVWKLPVGFESVDAAFNGALNREPYCYFFRDGRYVRYVWAHDTVDVGYPKPITSMVGMPASIAGGVDAAVDGGGGFADAGYFFRDEQYLRFQWVSGAAEPHADGDVRPIAGNWPGLLELLMASRAKSQALQWLGSAIATLGGFVASGGLADKALVDQALFAHYRVPVGDSPALKVPIASSILATLGQVVATLNTSATLFLFKTDAEAALDGWPAPPPAAYGSTAPMIVFTSTYPNRPELNRTSVVIHEAVHTFDAQSGQPLIHVPEWFVTAPTAAALSIPFQPDRPDIPIRYDLQSTADALHNPASHATFARHLFFRADRRDIL
jgi:hypothetical protein